MKFESSLEKYVLIVATLTAFFTVFLSSGVGVVIPSLAVDFGMSNIVQNWITTIFFLAVAVFTIPAGQISGKYGLKKSMVCGSALFIISSIFATLSVSSEMFLITRIFQGIGVAFLNVASMAIVVSAFKPENRGQAIGLNVTGVYLATSLSPVIAGFLNHQFTWHSIFYFTIPFLVFCLIVLIVKIDKEWKTFENVPIDKKGSVVYSIGILLFVYGFTTLNEMSGVILTIVGIIFLIAFAYLELKIKNPVFEVRFFKNPKFSSSNFAALSGYLATFAIVMIVNYHLQYIRGFSSQTSGLLLMITPVFQVVLAPLAGRLSDKVNPQKLSAIGIAIGAVAIGIIATLNEHTPLYVLAIALALQGIGFGIFSSPNNNAIMSSVPPKDTPIASASVATMRVIGQTLSLGMLTLVFAFVMGNVPIIPEYYPLLTLSCQIAAAICTVLCVISVFASLVGINSKPVKL